MYEINLLKNEKIELICDDAKIYTDDEFKIYTIIITNKRFLILDYPSSTRNSNEDLRTSQRLFYIRKKEIIFEIPLNNINLKIEKNNIKILLDNDQYILIINNEATKYLINIVNQK